MTPLRFRPRVTKDKLMGVTHRMGDRTRLPKGGVLRLNHKYVSCTLGLVCFIITLISELLVTIENPIAPPLVLNGSKTNLGLGHLIHE